MGSVDKRLQHRVSPWVSLLCPICCWGATFVRGEFCWWVAIGGAGGGRASSMGVHGAGEICRGRRGRLGDV